MKKNDKLIVLFGVVILVMASVGVYYWNPQETKKVEANLEDFFSISGVLSSIEPSAVTVTDSSPFYALIATPLTIHYDSDGTQHVHPLYVKDMGNPSQAVIRVESQTGMPVDEIIDDSRSAKECSIYIAKKYWNSSNAVLLIEDSELGYNLGVVATPIASYLSMPVIVTDKVDQEVRDVLNDLGVEFSIVCGDIDGYGDFLKFDNVDEIVDDSIELVMEKFGDADYITLANPRDAWSPEVLNVTTLSYRGVLKSSGNYFPSHLIDGILGKNKDVSYSFTIPEGYKYALVKIDFRNLEDPENIEKFADSVVVAGDLIKYASTVASPAKIDANGKIEYDRFYYETVLYDQGGKKSSIKLSPVFNIIKEAKYELYITIEKLSTPYYPLVKQLSSIAPYLTAYHKGIIYAKPEFAFAADDDKLLDGEKLPGSTTIKLNPILIPVSNEHVYENIHKPLNELLAKIRGIDITTEGGLENLTKQCYVDPFYVALVGDTTMLPQYYYRSPHNDPFKDQDKIYGTNCPSDFIYGNIDPETYFHQQNIGPDDVENDKYTYYPVVENIVGRITGWDVQDASALVARTVFYDYIIDGMQDWKDNALVMSGAGLEFQKLPIINTIHKLLKLDEPMKFPTGEQKFLNMRADKNLKAGGFNVETVERGQAQRVGYSNEALWEIKHDGILNRLFFPRLLVKLAQGFDNINSLFEPKWWMKALSDGSGIEGGELQENSNIILSNSHAIWFDFEHGDAMLYTMGGPPILYQILGRYIPIIGIRSSLDSVGAYSVREVSDMELGPSVMFVEGCGSGKIDSLNPTNTISQTYIHAGVNAYISPTTYSAIGGYLEPRPKWPLTDDGVGFGILGYLKAAINARRGIYPPVSFCGVVFEKSYQEMIKKNADIGTALRDARNAYLPEQANVTYLWTPPLSYSMTSNDDGMETTAAAGGGNRVIREKYCCVYQLNLLGDPAFNPYEPNNEGKGK